MNQSNQRMKGIAFEITAFHELQKINKDNFIRTFIGFESSIWWLFRHSIRLCFYSPFPRTVLYIFTDEHNIIENREFNSFANGNSELSFDNFSLINHFLRMSTETSIAAEKLESPWIDDVCSVYYTKCGVIVKQTNGKNLRSEYKPKLLECVLNIQSVLNVIQLLAHFCCCFFYAPPRPAFKHGE